jgi:hypothetical protein
LTREDALDGAKRDTKLQLVQASQMCCLAKPEVPDLAVQHHLKLNKGFKRAQAQYLERKDVKNKENKPASNLKHKVCYTCRGKGHLGKDCQNGNTSKSNLVNNLHVQLRRSHDGVSAGRMIKSSTIPPKAI